MLKTKLAASAALITLLSSTSVLAADADVEALRAEIHSMKQTYESRIAELESKLAKVEKKQATAPAQTSSSVVSTDASGRNTYANSFNPSIGVILNGKYGSFSNDTSEIAGFGVGEEGERGKEGLSLDESEVNFSANVDDKFAGNLTASIVREDGEDKIELEEAFVQTLPGIGLPTGMSVKAGRAFWTFGYMNEHHTHTDDFADRPLPYRAFLNNGFNDDGVQLSYILPTDFYSEIGGGVFRGDDYPFGSSSGDGAGSWSAYARVGGDIGEDQTWRLGGYVLSGKTDGRASHEGAVTFVGDSHLYAADLRYTWAPTGNPHEREVTLQGEYFWRSEDGTYEDTYAGTGAVAFDDHTSGWYAQAVYKFDPQWRIGVRYSQLESADTPSGLVGSALDADGYSPKAYSAMLDWTNSEFSRVRFQYNHEKLSRGEGDNQFLLQYVMSLGAHGAHVY